MSVDWLTNILVTVTLIEMMAAIGLSVTLGELAAVVRNWRLAGRAALANYVCVPAAAVGVLLLFDAPHDRRRGVAEELLGDLADGEPPALPRRQLLALLDLTAHLLAYAGQSRRLRARGSELSGRSPTT